MPIYDYECPECGRVDEIVLFGHKDSFHLTCQTCGAEMEKRIGAPAIVKVN